MNIAEVLRDRSAAMEGVPAIIEPTGSVTFAELDRRSASIAAQFAAAGVGAGDHALVICPMSIALYTVLIGLWRVGAVPVFLDPSAGRAHIDRCCRRVPPRAFVAVPRAHLLRMVSPALRAVPVQLSIDRWVPGARAIFVARGVAVRCQADASDPVSSGREVTRAGGMSVGICRCAPDTPALVTFTSGSTGEPKAAVRSHGFLLAQHRVLAGDLRLEAGQRDLSTLPIFVLANLASGVTSVIPDADLRRPGEIDPVPVLRQIAALGPTRVAASPAFLDRLARHAASLKQTIDRLEEIYTGGAPVFPGLLQRLHAAAPQARIVAVYGSTEAEPIAHVEWDAITSEDLCAMQSGAGLLAGRPVGAINLRILPDRWGEAIGPMSAPELDQRSLPAGQVGEIVVSGAHVLQGYLGGVGDTETKLRVGDRVWHRTGDAGYMDSSGRLWLMGRCSAKISDAQGELYPFAVECAALAAPGVRRCALVSRAGRRVLAVELEPATGDVHGALETTLAWAHIAEVVRVRSLPMDRRHNAKVDYPALASLLDRL